MKSLTAVFLFFLAFSPYIDGANWSSTFGEPDFDSNPTIVQTRDRGFAIAGRVFRSAGDSEIRVIKVDQFANIVWQKTYDSGYVFGPLFDRSEDNGFFLAAGTEREPWLSKLNPAGKIEWQKAIFISIGAIRHTQDGGAIVLGSFGGELCLVRLNNAGKIIWQGIYNLANSNPDRPGLIQQTRDGGSVVALPVHVGQLDSLWILHLDPNGNVRWQNLFAITGRAVQIDQTTDGSFVVSLYAAAGVTRVLKLDPLGKISWAHDYESRKPNAAQNMAATRDGGVLITGALDWLGEANLFLWKLDPLGKILWSKKLGGRAGQTGVAVLHAKDGDFVVGGHTNSFGAGKRDWWILKLDSTGNCNDCRFQIEDTEMIPHPINVGVTSRSVSIRKADVFITDTRVTVKPATAIAKRQCGARITAILPASAPPGRIITIQGTGFGKTQGSSQILFNGIPAGIAQSWSATEIKIRVPAAANTGPLNIQVNSTVSGGNQFIVLR